MAGSNPDNLSPAQDVMYCVNHPKTETLIRCSKCLDPICTKCAVRTPVGLRCPKCALGNRAPSYVVQPQHYLLVAVVALVASFIAGAVVAQIRFGLLSFLIIFFVSAPIGGLVAEAVWRVTRKRGRTVATITAVCIALGAFGGPWLWGVAAAGALAALPSNPLAYLASLLNITALVYTVLAIGAAIARLR
jgi:hypothetical protein